MPESVLSPQHRKQVPNFGIELRWVPHGLGDFFLKEDSITFAKTMDRNF
jgi:hypothetical protein